MVGILLRKSSRRKRPYLRCLHSQLSRLPLHILASLIFTARARFRDVIALTNASNVRPVYGE